MKIIRYCIIFSLLTVLFFTSCTKGTTPKPKGYFRIDFPSKSYLSFNENFPYRFEFPSYADKIIDTLMFAEPFWMNVDFKENNAKIHLSYKKVNNNLRSLTEDSREFAYKHSIKATAINESIFMNAERKVFGTIYEIKGNTASPLQFHLTDSVNHFLRGSFYISEVPNYDSLQPVIKFIEEDIYHLIETFSWN